MRLDEQRIKQAILHSNPEPRIKAISYFVDACSADESVMPFVIETVENHGRESALFRTLRRADALAQSPPTIDWLIDELRVDRDRSEKHWDNYQFSLALILLNADPQLIADRRDVIVSAPGFHEKLIPMLDGRLDLHRADWRGCWDRWVELCTSLAGDDWFTISTTRSSHQIIDALGRKLANDPDARKAWEREYSCLNRGKTEWLAEWSQVRLMGAMRDASAVPWLLEQMTVLDEMICDEAVTALSRIGTDQVVLRIGEAYPHANEIFRDYATELLSNIHSHSIVDVCLRLLEDAEEVDTAISLGHALLAHFDDRAIEPVCKLFQELGGVGVHPESDDLMYDLLRTCTIMDRRFDEYAELMEFAEETNWGWGDYQQPRLSDSFFDDTQTLEDAVGDMMPESEQEFELPDLGDADVSLKKVGRNDPCPCGSGKKYKKCCLHLDEGDALLN